MLGRIELMAKMQPVKLPRTQRMTLRVEQGKGAKDRYAMLSPVLLQRLRTWWDFAHAQGKMLASGWLFPGMTPLEPLSMRQLNRAVHGATEAAGINKRVSAAAKRWLDARQADLLPVEYYHVVFTLPAPIADLAYRTRQNSMGCCLTWPPRYCRPSLLTPSI